jgi:hypothetical protein
MSSRVSFKEKSTSIIERYFPSEALMTEAVSFQTVIEFVEALSEDEQDELFTLIQKRRVLKRRQEIAQNAEKTLEALRNGTAKRGTAAEVMADIFGEEE